MIASLFSVPRNQFLKSCAAAAFAAIAVATLSVVANAQTSIAAPGIVSDIPAPPIAARSYVLFDVGSNQILAGLVADRFVDGDSLDLRARFGIEESGQDDRRDPEMLVSVRYGRRAASAG